MTSLEWNLLAEKFYSFKVIADQFSFYVPELQGMEDSLDKIRPYAGSNEKAKEMALLGDERIPHFIPESDFVGDAYDTPEFDENDELVSV